MSKVTTDMLFAAIKQAGKEGIIKEREIVPTKEYERRLAAWERVIKAVLDAQ